MSELVIDPNWNEFPNGHVDGDRPEKKGDNRDIDPFEHLLGICRVTGLYYEVRYWESTKTWSAKLTSTSWPGDFYRTGHQNGKRSHTVCGCKTRLEALSSAYTMTFHALKNSCTQWRRIVAKLPEFESWEIKPL